MGAGIVTLRLDTRLVGLRADTAWTLTRLRTLLAPWIDDDHPEVPWALDVRLDPLDVDSRSPTPARRGPVPVPQLRLHRTLVSRSRSADEVLRSLGDVLGGIHASHDDRMWSGMRAFVQGDRAVLFDERPPALTADPALARVGVTELSTWRVLVDGPDILRLHVPPALGGLRWADLGLDAPPAAWRTYELAGIVGVDHRSRHRCDLDHGEADIVSAIEPATLLSLFSVRHPSKEWFAIVDRLVRRGRAAMSPDAATARQRIIELLEPW